MLFSGGSLDEELQRELADRNRTQIATFLSQHLGQHDLNYSTVQDTVVRKAEFPG